MSPTVYANNYLFPRDLAAEASGGALKMLEQQNRAKQRRQAEEVANAREVADQLEALVLKVSAKAGGNGRLFGTVTTRKSPTRFTRSSTLRSIGTKSR